MIDVRLSVRVPSEVVLKARELVRSSNRYDNLSHYVRAALIRLNQAHSSGDLPLKDDFVMDELDDNIKE